MNRTKDANILLSGDRTPIGHDFESNNKIKTINTQMNTNSSVFVNRLKRSKSSDKSIKYCDSSTMDSVESYFNETDIKANGSPNQNSIDESKTSVPLEEEIKSLSTSSSSSMFPTLPDVILRKLQLLRESCCSLESLNEQEVESKFATLSLSFKTDKLTLNQRVNLHKHQRDVSEQDANNELESLRDYIKNLNQLIFSSDDLILTNIRSEIKELLIKIETQIQVVGQTNAKISSRAELYGAVKQEERVSSVFDVVFLHSENLKKAKDKERKELERTKQLLTSDGKKTDFETDSETESVPMRRSIRSISTTVIPKMNLIRVRRASVSSVEILPNSDIKKSVQHNISSKYVTTSPSYLLNRSRRCSMPATSTALRPRNGIENECSHLEITTEEKCGSDSECASSVANPDSDDEHISHPRLHLRLCEEIVENSSNSSEQNNNLLNTINDNNKAIETTISQRISQRISHQTSEKISQNSTLFDYNINNNDNQLDNEDNQRKTSLNIIEFKYLIDLIILCFEGTVGSYIKQLVQEMRLILAVILFITAIVIVVWSLLPLSFPCDCRCNWTEFIDKYYSKQSFNPNS